MTVFCQAKKTGSFQHHTWDHHCLVSWLMDVANKLHLGLRKEEQRGTSRFEMKEKSTKMKDATLQGTFRDKRDFLTKCCLIYNCTYSPFFILKCRLANWRDECCYYRKLVLHSHTHLQIGKITLIQGRLGHNFMAISTLRERHKGTILLVRINPKSNWQCSNKSCF